MLELTSDELVYAEAFGLTINLDVARYIGGVRYETSKAVLRAASIVRTIIHQPRLSICK